MSNSDEVLYDVPYRGCTVVISFKRFSEHGIDKCGYRANIEGCDDSFDNWFQIQDEYMLHPWTVYVDAGDIWDGATYLIDFWWEQCEKHGDDWFDLQQSIARSVYM